MRRYNLTLFNLNEHFNLYLGEDGHFNLTLPSFDGDAFDVTFEGLIDHIYLTGLSQLILDIDTCRVTLGQMVDGQVSLAIDIEDGTNAVMTSYCRIDASLGLVKAIAAALSYVYASVNNNMKSAIEGQEHLDVYAEPSSENLYIDVSSILASVLVAMPTEFKLLLKNDITAVYTAMTAHVAHALQIDFSVQQIIDSWCQMAPTSLNVSLDVEMPTVVVLAYVADWTDFTIEELKDMSIQDMIYTEVVE